MRVNPGNIRSLTAGWVRSPRRRGAASGSIESVSRGSLDKRFMKYGEEATPEALVESAVGGFAFRTWLR